MIKVAMQKKITKITKQMKHRLTWDE